MKLALLALALLLVADAARVPISAPPAAQTSQEGSAQNDLLPSELTVRLYAIHSPSEIRISPVDASARIRLCANCEAKLLPQQLSIHASGAQLVLPTSAGAHAVYIFGAYRLDSPGNQPLELQWPLELFAEGGRVRVQVRMPLEEYVAAVVAGEGVGFTSDESLKAMAVVARTFALHFVNRHRAEGFNLCDTTHCQDLHLGALSARMRAAAEATRGELLWYQGRPAATFHHRHCGGSTEDAAVVWPDEAAPYLRAHADEYCLARDPGKWRAEILKRDIARALAASHLSAPGRLDSLAVLERSTSGRAVRLQLEGSERFQLRAADLRFAIGRALGWDKITSDLYEVHDAGESVVFEGRGAGHGVGMCQTGAAELGSQGKTYREILAFYFPGTTPGKEPPRLISSLRRR